MALPPAWLTIFIAAHQAEVPITREQAATIAEHVEVAGWRVVPAWAVPEMPPGVIEAETAL
jgi:hypothetical protein